MQVTLHTEFDSRAFSLDAIKKAAYIFIDKFSIDIKFAEELIICTLSFAPNIEKNSATTILVNFKKEVLDQDLREKISKETEEVRNLILAHAFSKTSIIKNG